MLKMYKHAKCDGDLFKHNINNTTNEIGSLKL